MAAAARKRLGLTITIQLTCGTRGHDWQALVLFVWTKLIPRAHRRKGHICVVPERELVRPASFRLAHQIGRVAVERRIAVTPELV